MISDRELYAMSPKQLKQYTLIQKLHIFYINKSRKKMKEDIKNGKLILKKDLEESQNELIKYSLYTLRDNHLSETQINHIVSFKKDIQGLREYFRERMLASLCEIAYSEPPKKCKININIFFDEMKREVKKKVENFIKLEDLEDNETTRKKIINFLGSTEDILRKVLDEIKYPCEFERVIIFIVSCDTIAGLPKRDRKRLYEEKRKFERLKKSTIENLKALNLPYDEVEQKEFSSPELLGWHNYETTLKHYQSILFYTLTSDCETSKKRANEIIEILEHL